MRLIIRWKIEQNLKGDAGKMLRVAYPSAPTNPKCCLIRGGGAGTDALSVGGCDVISQGFTLFIYVKHPVNLTKNALYPPALDAYLNRSQKRKLDLLEKIELVSTIH